MKILKSKGQSSIEFLFVFGLAMLVASPFILSAQESIVRLQTGSDMAELQNSMDKMDTAVSRVGTSGPPARRSFTINLPRNVEEVFVVQEKAVVYTVNTTAGVTNISRIFDHTVRESGRGLPDTRGVHRVSVTAWQDQVNLSEAN